MATRVPVLSEQFRCGTSNTFFWNGMGSVPAAGAQTSLDENSKTVVPIAGNITELYIRANTATGTGTSVLTLMVNGSATAATCTIAANGSTASATGLSVAVAAGDTISIRIQNNNGATIRQYSAAWVLQPTTAGESMVWGGPFTYGTNNFYCSPVCPSGYVPNGTYNIVAAVMPCAGTLDHLYVRMTANIAAAKTMTVTLYKNGSSTGLTVTINAGASTGSDLTNSVVVAAGDTFAWIGTHTDAFPNVKFSVGCRFVPSGARKGTPVFFTTGASNPAATRFCPFTVDANAVCSVIGATDPNDGSTTAPRSIIPGVFWSLALYQNQSVGSGAGKTSVMTLSVNGSLSGLTCTSTGAGTGAGVNASHDTVDFVKHAAFDQVNVKWVESAAATANVGHVSVALSDSPPGGPSGPHGMFFFAR